MKLAISQPARIRIVRIRNRTPRLHVIASPTVTAGRTDAQPGGMDSYLVATLTNSKCSSPPFTSDSLTSPIPFA